MTPLRVAVTADPYLPVPPALYGGIERVIDLLVRGLVARGHSVTLFAHPGTRTAGDLVPYGCPPHRGRRARATELWQVGWGLLRRRFDVVHSFGRLAALVPVLPLRALAKVQSYQRAIPWRGVAFARRLAGASVRFTACSRSLLGSASADAWRVVYNGVDLKRYRCADSVPADAPLVFLGRLEPIKGAHGAIAIARRARRRLVLAGNRVDDGAAQGYFEREIAPHVDGERVRYVGPVDDAAKGDLLGSAAALLMPVEWDEPFGIVMAEALACGTPVIGFPRGSVPEVVRDGQNGFLCADVDAAAAAVGRLAGLSRRGVRQDCEARFGASVMIDAYERLYAELVESLRGRTS